MNNLQQLLNQMNAALANVLQVAQNPQPQANPGAALPQGQTGPSFADPQESEVRDVDGKVLPVVYRQAHAVSRYTSLGILSKVDAHARYDYSDLRNSYDFTPQGYVIPEDFVSPPSMLPDVAGRREQFADAVSLMLIPDALVPIYPDARNRIVNIIRAAISGARNVVLSADLDEVEYMHAPPAPVQGEERNWIGTHAPITAFADTLFPRDPVASRKLESDLQNAILELGNADAFSLLSIRAERIGGNSHYLNLCTVMQDGSAYFKKLAERVKLGNPNDKGYLTDDFHNSIDKFSKNLASSQKLAIDLHAELAKAGTLPVPANHQPLVDATNANPPENLFVDDNGAVLVNPDQALCDQIIRTYRDREVARVTSEYHTQEKARVIAEFGKKLNDALMGIQDGEFVVVPIVLNDGTSARPLFIRFSASKSGHQGKVDIEMIDPQGLFSSTLYEQRGKQYRDVHATLSDVDLVKEWSIEKSSLLAEQMSLSLEAFSLTDRPAKTDAIPANSQTYGFDQNETVVEDLFKMKEDADEDAFMENLQSMFYGGYSKMQAKAALAPYEAVVRKTNHLTPIQIREQQIFRTLFGGLIATKKEITPDHRIHMQALQNRSNEFKLVSALLRRQVGEENFAILRTQIRWDAWNAEYQKAIQVFEFAKTIDPTTGRTNYAESTEEQRDNLLCSLENRQKGAEKLLRAINKKEATLQGNPNKKLLAQFEEATKFLKASLTIATGNLQKKIDQLTLGEGSFNTPEWKKSYAKFLGLQNRYSIWKKQYDLVKKEIDALPNGALPNAGAARNNLREKVMGLLEGVDPNANGKDGVYELAQDISVEVNANRTFDADPVIKPKVVALLTDVGNAAAWLAHVRTAINNATPITQAAPKLDVPIIKLEAPVVVNNAVLKPVIEGPLLANRINDLPLTFQASRLSKTDVEWILSKVAINPTATGMLSLADHAMKGGPLGDAFMPLMLNAFPLDEALEDKWDTECKYLKTKLGFVNHTLKTEALGKLLETRTSGSPVRTAATQKDLDTIEEWVLNPIAKKQQASLSIYDSIHEQITNFDALRIKLKEEEIAPKEAQVAEKQAKIAEYTARIAALELELAALPPPTDATILEQHQDIKLRISQVKLAKGAYQKALAKLEAVVDPANVAHDDVQHVLDNVGVLLTQLNTLILARHQTQLDRIFTDNDRPSDSERELTNAIEAITIEIETVLNTRLSDNAIDLIANIGDVFGTLKGLFDAVKTGEAQLNQETAARQLDLDALIHEKTALSEAIPEAVNQNLKHNIRQLVRPIQELGLKIEEINNDRADIETLYSQYEKEVESDATIDRTVELGLLDKEAEENAAALEKTKTELEKTQIKQGYFAAELARIKKAEGKQELTEEEKTLAEMKGLLSLGAVVKEMLANPRNFQYSMEPLATDEIGSIVQDLIRSMMGMKESDAEADVSLTTGQKELIAYFQQGVTEFCKKLPTDSVAAMQAHWAGLLEESEISEIDEMQSKLFLLLEFSSEIATKAAAEEAGKGKTAIVPFEMQNQLFSLMLNLQYIIQNRPYETLDKNGHTVVIESDSQDLLFKEFCFSWKAIIKKSLDRTCPMHITGLNEFEKTKQILDTYEELTDAQGVKHLETDRALAVLGGGSHYPHLWELFKKLKDKNGAYAGQFDAVKDPIETMFGPILERFEIDASEVGSYYETCCFKLFLNYFGSHLAIALDSPQEKKGAMQMLRALSFMQSAVFEIPVDEPKPGKLDFSDLLTTPPAMAVAIPMDLAIRGMIATQNPGLNAEQLDALVDQGPYLGSDYTAYSSIFMGVMECAKQAGSPAALDELRARYQELLQSGVKPAKNIGFFSATGFLRAEEEKDGLQPSMVSLGCLLNKKRQENPETYAAYDRLMREYANLDPNTSEEDRLKDDNLVGAQAFAATRYKSPIHCILGTLTRTKPAPVYFTPHTTFQFDMMLLRQNALLEMPAGASEAEQEIYYNNLRSFINTHMSPTAAEREQNVDILTPLLKIADLRDPSQNYGIHQNDLSGFNQGDINSFTRAFCGKHSNLMNALKFFENNPQMLQSYFWRNLLRCAFSQVWEEPVIEIDEDGNEVKKVKLHHIIENHTDEAFLKYFQKWCSVALGKVRKGDKDKKQDADKAANNQNQIDQGPAIAKLIFDLTTQLEATTDKETSVTTLGTTRKGEERNSYKLDDVFATLLDKKGTRNQFNYYDALVGMKPEQQIDLIDRAVQYWAEMAKKYPDDVQAREQLLITSIIAESFKKPEQDSELKAYLREILFPGAKETAKIEITYTNGVLKITGREIPIAPPKYIITLKYENSQFIHTIEQAPDDVLHQAMTTFAQTNFISQILQIPAQAAANAAQNIPQNTPVVLPQEQEERLLDLLKASFKHREQPPEAVSASSTLLRQKTEQNVREILHPHAEWIEQNKDTILNQYLLPHFNSYKVQKEGNRLYGVDEFTIDYHIDLVQRRLIATLQPKDPALQPASYCLCHYIPDSVEPKETDNLSSLDTENDVDYRNNLRRLLTPVLGHGEVSDLSRIKIDNLDEVKDAQAKKEPVIVEFEHIEEENPARLSRFYLDVTDKNHIMDAPNNPLGQFLTSDYLGDQYTCLFAQSSLVYTPYQYNAPDQYDIERPLVNFFRGNASIVPHASSTDHLIDTMPNPGRIGDLETQQGLTFKLNQTDSTFKSIADNKIIVKRDAVTKQLSYTIEHRVPAHYWGLNDTVTNPRLDANDEAEFFRQVETFCAETTKNAELVLNRARTRENLRTLQTFVAQLAKQEKIGIHVNYDFVSYITPREFTLKRRKENHVIWYHQDATKPGHYTLLIVEPITCAIRYKIEVTPDGKEKITKMTSGGADQVITLADTQVEQQLQNFLSGEGQEATLFKGATVDNPDKTKCWPVKDAARVENEPKTTIPRELLLTHTRDINGRELGFRINKDNSDELLCNQDPSLLYKNEVAHALFQNIPDDIHYTILPFSKKNAKFGQYDTKYYISLSYQDLADPMNPHGDKKAFEHHPFLEFEITGDKINPVQKIPGTLFLAQLYFRQGKLTQAWKELNKLTLVERQELKNLSDKANATYVAEQVKVDDKIETHMKKDKNIKKDVCLRLIDDIQLSTRREIARVKGSPDNLFGDANRTRLAELNAFLLKAENITQFKQEADIEEVCKRGTAALEDGRSHGSEFLDTAIEIYGRLSNYRKGLDTVLPKHFQLSPENELDLIELIIKLSSTIVRTDCHELKEFFSSPEKIPLPLVQTIAKAIAGDRVARLAIGSDSVSIAQRTNITFGIKPQAKKEDQEKEREVAEAFQKMLFATDEFKLLLARKEELQKINRGETPTERLPKQMNNAHSLAQVSTTILFDHSQEEGPDNKLLLFKSSALNFPAGKSHADLDPLNQIADQYNNYFRSLRGVFSENPDFIDKLMNSTNEFQKRVKPNGAFGKAFNQYVDYFKFRDAVNTDFRVNEGNVPAHTYHNDIVETIIMPVRDKLLKGTGAIPDATKLELSQKHNTARAEASLFLTGRIAAITSGNNRIKLLIKADIDKAEADLKAEEVAHNAKQVQLEAAFEADQNQLQQASNANQAAKQAAVDAAKAQINLIKNAINAQYAGFPDAGQATGWASPDYEQNLKDWYALWKTPGANGKNDVDTPLYTQYKKAIADYRKVCADNGCIRGWEDPQEFLRYIEKLGQFVEGFNNKKKEKYYNAESHRDDIKDFCNRNWSNNYEMDKSERLNISPPSFMRRSWQPTHWDTFAERNKKATALQKKFAPQISELAKLYGEEPKANNDRTWTYWFSKLIKKDINDHTFDDVVCTSYLGSNLWVSTSDETLERLKNLQKLLENNTTPNAMHPGPLFDATTWLGTVNHPDWKKLSQHVRNQWGENLRNALCALPNNKLMQESKLKIFVTQAETLDAFLKLDKGQYESALVRGTQRSSGSMIKGAFPEEHNRIDKIAEYTQKLALHRYQTVLRNQFIAQFRTKAETIIATPNLSKLQISEKLAELSLQVESLTFNFLTDARGHASMMNTNSKLVPWIHEVADGLALFRKSLDAVRARVGQNITQTGGFSQEQQEEIKQLLKVGIPGIDGFDTTAPAQAIHDQFREIEEELTTSRDKAHTTLTTRAQALAQKMPTTPADLRKYLDTDKKRKDGCWRSELPEVYRSLLQISNNGEIETAAGEKIQKDKTKTQGAFLEAQQACSKLVKKDADDLKVWKKTLQDKLGALTLREVKTNATNNISMTANGKKKMYTPAPQPLADYIRKRPVPAAVSRTILAIDQKSLELSSLSAALYDQKSITEHLSAFSGSKQTAQKMFLDLYQPKQARAGSTKAEADKERAELDKALDVKVKAQMAEQDNIDLLGARVTKHQNALQLVNNQVQFADNDVRDGFRRVLRDQNQWEAKGTGATHLDKCNKLIASVTAQEAALNTKKAELKTQLITNWKRDPTDTTNVDDWLHQVLGDYIGNDLRDLVRAKLPGTASDEDIIEGTKAAAKLITEYLVVSVEQEHLARCKNELAKVAGGTGEDALKRVSPLLAAPIAYKLSDERSRDYLVYEHLNGIRLTQEEILAQTTRDILGVLNINHTVEEQFARIFRRKDIDEGLSQAEAEKRLDEIVDAEMKLLENDPNSDLNLRLKIYELDVNNLSEDEVHFEDAIRRELEFSKNDLRAGYRKNLKNSMPWELKNGMDEADGRHLIDEIRNQKEHLGNHHITELQKLLEQMLNSSADPIKNLEIQSKISSGARATLRIEDLVDAYMIGNIGAYRAILQESEFSNADLLEIDRLIKIYLYAAVEYGHLSRIVEDIDGKMKDKSSITALEILKGNELAGKIASHMEYKLTDERARLYLAFEYRQNIRLRAEQITALNDLSAEDAVIQMIMGGGKTSVLGALLLRQMANKKQAAIFIAPGAQIDTLCGNLNENQGKIFNQDIFVPRAEHRDQFTETYLTQLLSDYKRAKENSYVILTRAELFQMLELEYLTLLNQTDNDKDDRGGDIGARIALLAELLGDIRKEGTALIDEVDLILNPLKEVNFPIGSRESIKYKYRELMGEFMKYHCDPTIMVNVPRKDADGKVMTIQVARLDAKGKQVTDKNGPVFDTKIDTEKKRVVDELGLLSGNQAQSQIYPLILDAIVEEFWKRKAKDVWNLSETDEKLKKQFKAYILDESLTDANGNSLYKAGQKTPKQEFRDMLNDTQHAQRDEIALLKFLCTQVAPLCMTRKAGKNFGRVKSTQEVPQEVIREDKYGNISSILKPSLRMKPYQAVPYLAIDTPASTEFGLKEEAALYSLMTAVSKGIEYEQIADISEKDLQAFRRLMEKNSDDLADTVLTFEELQELESKLLRGVPTKGHNLMERFHVKYAPYGIPFTLIYQAIAEKKSGAIEALRDKIAEINGQWRPEPLKKAFEALRDDVDGKIAIGYQEKKALEAAGNKQPYTNLEILHAYLLSKKKLPSDFLKEKITDDFVSELNVAAPPNKNAECLINIEVASMENTVRYYADGYFSSNPHNFCSMLASRRAFSGTPNRNDTAFYKGMSDVKFELGTEGRIADAMLAREKALNAAGQNLNPIHVLEESESIKIEDIFTQVVDKMDDEKQKRVRGFIDVSGVMGEYKNNEEVARLFLDQIRKNKNMDEIKYVLFYGRRDSSENAPDTFMAIDRDGNREILGTSLESVLKTKGIFKENVFVCYDQRHCEATDIKQHPTAINLLSVGESIERRSLMQAMLRLRQYFQGQDVEYVGLPKAIKKLCPNKDPKDFTVADLLKASTINLAKEKARMTMRAYQHKMIDVVRSKVMDAMLAVPKNLRAEKPTESQSQINKLAKKQAQDIREAATRYFIKGQVLEPFEAFGDVQEYYSSEALLKGYRDHILKFLGSADGKTLIDLIGGKTTIVNGKPETGFMTDIRKELNEIIGIVENKKDQRWCFPNKVLAASPDSEDSSETTVENQTETQNEQQTEKENAVEQQVAQENELATEQSGHILERPFQELGWDPKRDFRTDRFLKSISQIVTASADKEGTPRIYSLDAIFQDRHQNTLLLAERGSNGVGHGVQIQITQNVFGDQILMTENCRFTIEGSKHHILNANIQKPLDRIVVYQDTDGKLKALLISENEAGVFKKMIEENCENKAHICNKMILLHGYDRQAGSNGLFSELLNPNTERGKQFELLMFKLDAARGRSDYADMLRSTNDPNADGAEEDKSRLNAFVKRNFSYTDESFKEISKDDFNKLNFVRQCQYLGKRREFDRKRTAFYKEAAQLIQFTDVDFNMPEEVVRQNRIIRREILSKPSCPEAIVEITQPKDRWGRKNATNLMIKKVAPSILEKIKLPIKPIMIALVGFGYLASAFATLTVVGLFATFIWNLGVVAIPTVVGCVATYIILSMISKLCFRGTDKYIAYQFAAKLRTTHWQSGKKAAQVTHEKMQAQQIIAARHPTEKFVSCIVDNLQMRLFNFGAKKYLPPQLMQEL